MVGASGTTDSGTNSGAAWILTLNQNGTVSSKHKISPTSGGFDGVIDASDYLGYAVASFGDLNKDYAEDFAIAAYQDDDGGSNRGAVWITAMNELTPSTCLDFATSLAPYLSSLPNDPSLGTTSSTYYAVKKLMTGRLMMRSCAAELGEKIYLTE